MKEISGTYLAKQYEPGTTFPYTVLVPEAGTDADTGVIVFCDGLNCTQVAVAKKLMAEGYMPQCILVGLTAGVRHPTKADRIGRGMRMKNYDMRGREYPNFVVDEFLPWLCAAYGLTYTQDPNRHMFTGGSSGGCCAWNAAWYRNDFFRRVFLSSPSMLAMGGMDEYLSLVRKYEPRPIRCFITLGENEPDDYFGSSYAVGIAMQRALTFAGYDCGYAYFPGEGHCCRSDDPAVMELVYRYLWENWDSEPVLVKQYNSRVGGIVTPDTCWEKTFGTVLHSEAVTTDTGSYKIQKNTIVFTDGQGNKMTVAEDFRELTSIALSPDGWRLYAADRSMRYIEVFSVREDGTLCDRDRLCLLHVDSESRHLGAYDICVDGHDRIFAATDLGIQCVRSFGLVDVILPMPGDKPAYSVAYDGEKQMLFAGSDGKVFCRKLAEASYPIPDEGGLRCVSYYD